MKIAEIELDGINNKGGDNVISTNTAVNDDSENEIVTEEEILPMNTKDLEESNTTPTRKKKQIRSNKTLIKNQKSQTETAILNIIQKDISWKNSVGWRGTLVLTLIIFLILFYLYGLYVYSDFFNCSIEVCPASIFFLFFIIIFSLLFCYITCRWKEMMKSRLKFLKRRTYRSKHGLKKLFQTYTRNFGLHGKYYFYKLYASEVLEKTFQTYNFVTIYTCMFPYWFTLLFCVLYVVDSSILTVVMYKRTFTANKLISTGERDLQVIRDVIFDLICAIIPLVVPYLAYGIPTNINETILILLMPSISLFGKTRTLFKEALYTNADGALLKKQNQESHSLQRRRQSLYRLTISEKEARQQSRNFIKPVRIILFIIGLGHSLLFITIFFIQLNHGINLESHEKTCVELYTSNNYNESANIWKENGCVVKTPFCYSAFQPTCNCAYLSLESTDKPPVLDNIVNSMTALKRVEIINCNLKTLPKKMENLKLIAYLDLSYNQLTDFNVNIQEWIYIATIYLQFNNISTVNTVAVWKNPTLITLNIKNNPKLKISSNIEISMPMLKELDIRNNSMVLPNRFGKEEFPALIRLYLSGNNLQQFPDNFQTLNKGLSDLYIARCQLTMLSESYLAKLDNLLYFDARDNNISVIDSTFKNMVLLDESNMRAYFSGNPICKLDVDLQGSKSCEEMCSKYCWYKSDEVDENAFGCDAECNTEKCNYDQGDCTKSLKKIIRL